MKVIRQKSERQQLAARYEDGTLVAGQVTGDFFEGDKGCVPHEETPEEQRGSNSVGA